MADSLEERLLAHGVTTHKLIRVSDGGPKGSLFGMMLISIKNYRDGGKELVTIRITSLTNTITGGSAVEKLSINKLEAHIDHIDMNITLGPSTGISMEEQLRNRGIGTYAFNELILFLQRTVPNYNINTFEYAVDDGFPQESKDRLVSFFNKFNIAFNFTDSQQHAGYMRAATPQQLTNYYNQNKIQEVELEKYLFHTISERNRFDAEVSSLKHEFERMSDETFAGIPKSQLIKYTLIACGISFLFVILMII